MKKIILAVVLLLSLCLNCVVMTGCNNNQQISDFVIPEGGYDGSEVTINFYHTMGQNLRDVLDLYIAEFNKLYPNIHINHQQVGS